MNKLHPMIKKITWGPKTSSKVTVQATKTDRDSKEVTVVYNDGSTLLWDPANIEILRADDGSLIVDGPRHEAWMRFQIDHD